MNGSENEAAKIVESLRTRSEAEAGQKCAKEESPAVTEGKISDDVKRRKAIENEQDSDITQYSDDVEDIPKQRGSREVSQSSDGPRRRSTRLKKDAPKG